MQKIFFFASFVVAADTTHDLKCEIFFKFAIEKIDANVSIEFEVTDSTSFISFPSQLKTLTFLHISNLHKIDLNI